ncbi:hypothetical protein ICNINCKA_02587 [Synechococcus sp. CBW1107]|nr:hypothetical protein ICNINCKA_02587 [Synechococcus sp. CBW1107]
MIEGVSALQEDALAFSFQGQITADDDDHMLTPALDRALEHDHLRLLAQLGQVFEGYDLGAAWSRRAVAAFSLVRPCPVRVFANAELEGPAAGWWSRWARSIWSGRARRSRSS